MRPNLPGYSLIELMLILAMVGVIATLAGQNYTVFVGKARRTEALNVLRGLAVAEEEYYASHGRFSGSFEEVGFNVAAKGGKRISATLIQGVQYEFNLSQPDGPGSYYCSAVGDIDYDGWPDVITIGDNR